MAATDFLSFKTSIAERAIHYLYALALVLIALDVVFGVWKGAMIAGRPPMTNPPVATKADVHIVAPPMQDAEAEVPQINPMWSHGFHHHQFGRHYFMMRHHPVRAGVFKIIRTLVEGFAALLTVRILAELTLLALQRLLRPVGRPDDIQGSPFTKHRLP